MVATDPKPAHAGVYVTSCTGTQVYLSKAEKRMLTLHNQERHDWGLPAFCVHPALQKAAKAHSKEMIDMDYFSHNSFDGESISDRLTRYGYDWSACAENIAWGTGSKGSPAYIFQSWMDSSGHQANILNSGYKEIGIGAARGTYQAYSDARMWTVDFGTRK